MKSDREQTAVTLVRKVLLQQTSGLVMQRPRRLQPELMLETAIEKQSGCVIGAGRVLFVGVHFGYKIDCKVDYMFRDGVYVPSRVTGSLQDTEHPAYHYTLELEGKEIPSL